MWLAQGSYIAPHFSFLTQCPDLTAFGMVCWPPGVQQTLPILVTVLEQGHLRLLNIFTLTNNVPDHVMSSCLRALAPLLSLDCNNTEFGPLAYLTLGPHFATLQKSHLYNRMNVQGDMTQAVLESCPILVNLLAPTVTHP